MFALIKVGERSGMGLCDIYNYWKEYGYEKPVIKETINPDRITFMLNIEYEGNRGINDGNHDGNDGNRDGNIDGNLGEMESCVFSVIKENNTLSAKKIAEKLGVSASTVERATKKLKALNYIERDGKTRGAWIILK
jgi:predicted HTH transcriptional regulator